MNFYLLGSLAVSNYLRNQKMDNFIRLKDLEEKDDLLIRKHDIQSVYTDNGRTTIDTRSNVFTVKESIDEVAKKLRGETTKSLPNVDLDNFLFGNYLSVSLNRDDNVVVEMTYSQLLELLGHFNRDEKAIQYDANPYEEGLKQGTESCFDEVRKELLRLGFNEKKIDEIRETVFNVIHQ